eukprot:scaffold2966_cov143-Skeletonema_menzelii.AAC.12
MKFVATLLALYSCPAALAFSSVKSNRPSSSLHASRRDVVAVLASFALPSIVNAAAAVQDSLEIEEFLRTGVDAGGNMGVSSQAGKSRPQTGVVFRDGTDVLQSKKGDVSAEILVGTKADPKSVLISFTAPYKLETGSVYDVECRDQKTGDGAFLAVTEKADGKSLEELDSSFFMKRLFDPTGRFSFYGPPTDVKVKKSTMIDNGKRLLEVSFSNLSQSTNAEIPRTALIVATIPKGTDNAVMLVASANASRWKKGSDVASKTIVDSFSAIPSPRTSMKLRVKDRSNGASIDF